MKKKIVLMLFLGFVLVNFNFAEDEPPVLTVRIDSDGKGYTVKNTDDVSHDVVLEVTSNFPDGTTRKSTHSIKVEARSIFTNRVGNTFIGTMIEVVIVDWI